MALTREKFYVIVPKAATNYITNPRFEYGTTGWTVLGAGTTFALDSTWQRRGVNSLKCTQAGASVFGAYRTIDLTSGTEYTFSVDVKDTAHNYRVAILNSRRQRTKRHPLRGWVQGSVVRKAVTWTADASATFRVEARRADAVAGSFLDRRRAIGSRG